MIWIIRHNIYPFLPYNTQILDTVKLGLILFLEDLEHVVGRLPLDVDGVHLDNLVPHSNQACGCS